MKNSQCCGPANGNNNKWKWVSFLGSIRVWVMNLSTLFSGKRETFLSRKHHTVFKVCCNCNFVILASTRNFSKYRKLKIGWGVAFSSSGIVIRPRSAAINPRWYFDRHGAMIRPNYLSMAQFSISSFVDCQLLWFFCTWIAWHQSIICGFGNACTIRCERGTIQSVARHQITDNQVIRTTIHLALISAAVRTVFPSVVHFALGFCLFQASSSCGECPESTHLRTQTHAWREKTIENKRWLWISQRIQRNLWHEGLPCGFNWLHMAL